MFNFSIDMLVIFSINMDTRRVVLDSINDYFASNSCSRADDSDEEDAERLFARHNNEAQQVRDAIAARATTATAMELQRKRKREMLMSKRLLTHIQVDYRCATHSNNF